MFFYAWAYLIGHSTVIVSIPPTPVEEEYTPTVLQVAGRWVLSLPRGYYAGVGGMTPDFGNEIGSPTSDLSSDYNSEDGGPSVSESYAHSSDNSKSERPHPGPAQPAEYETSTATGQPTGGGQERS